MTVAEDFHDDEIYEACPSCLGKGIQTYDDGIAFICPRCCGKCYIPHECDESCHE